MRAVLPPTLHINISECLGFVPSCNILMVVHSPPPHPPSSILCMVPMVQQLLPDPNRSA